MPRIYVGATPLAEARERLLAAARPRPLPGEEVPAAEADGRVTAGLVTARLSSPHYHASAMDGYAVVAASTFGASERRPVVLTVDADAVPTPSPDGSGAAADADARATAVRVDTGDPLPEGFDAVVPLEEAIEVGGAVELQAAVYPWRHVRVQGEDIVAGQVLFPENYRLGPADIGLLLAAGVTTVHVRRRPVVTIIPTGDEIICPLGGLALDPAPGQIIETNGTTAKLTLERWGAEVHRRAPVPDDPRRLEEVLDEALEASDLVLIGAGSSAGRGDFTPDVIARRGRVLVHGVAVRPGKPVVIGMAAASGGPGGAGASGAGPDTGPAAGDASASEKPVLGLPGYPVSFALSLELYVKPLIYAWQGQAEPPPETVEARLGRAIPSPLGVDEFIRVKAARIGEGYVAVPLPRGAGLLSALSQADGTVVVPASREGLEAGETVTVFLSRSRRHVDRAILVSGSHDLLLDLLASRLAALEPGLSLSSGRIGSTGGLLALRDGLCHLAGTHLLDETTGDYNRGWVARLIPGRPVRLLTLAWRRQGLIIRPGNPLAIGGLGDLLRSDVMFVNRQRGSGTRVLLDYLLKTTEHRRNAHGVMAGAPEEDTPPGRPGPAGRGIRGYQREEGSHLGVASAVASGVADAGLGIFSAAAALDLDFVPVAEERYDLAYFPEFEDDPRLGLLRRILTSDEEFRRAVAKMGGYDLRDTGKETEVGG